MSSKASKFRSEWIRLLSAGVILDSFLPLISHIYSVSKFCWLCLRNMQNGNHFLSPSSPPLCIRTVCGLLSGHPALFLCLQSLFPTQQPEWGFSSPGSEPFHGPPFLSEEKPESFSICPAGPQSSLLISFPLYFTPTTLVSFLLSRSQWGPLH